MARKLTFHHQYGTGRTTTGVPQPIIDKLHGEIQKILVMKDVSERFALGGADTTPMSNADFDARVKKDTMRFRKIVAEAGITAE